METQGHSPSPGITEAPFLFEPPRLHTKFAVLETARYELSGGSCWAELKETSPVGASQRFFLIDTVFTAGSCRGRGLASTLMKKLSALADREQATLCLKAASFDPYGLSDIALLRFYKKFGFQLMDTSNNWMERLPRG